MGNKEELLNDCGYIAVKNWEHAKNLLLHDFYVLIGGHEIKNPVVSFHMNGQNIDIQVFDPSDMSMQKYKATWTAVEESYNTAVRNKMYIYAKPNMPDTHFMGRKPKETHLTEIKTVDGAFEFLNNNKSIVIPCDNDAFFITKIDDVIMMCCSDGRAVPLRVDQFKEMADGLIERGGTFIYDPALRTTALKIEIRPEKTEREDRENGRNDN